MRKTRYGIAGFGRFADKTIAPAIKQSFNSELVAVQNRNLSKAKDGASAHNAALAFDSVAEMVAHPDVDAVFIVSANSLHCPETLLAAAAGKHILCEKPMAMTAAECRKMIDACAGNNVKLMVGHMLRLSPLLLRIKELVRSGSLGRIIKAESNFVYDGKLSARSWLLDRRIAGGGPTFDIGVHCLDSLRFVLDDDVVTVKGELDPKPTGERTESSSQLLLRFSHGTTATIYSSFESAIRESSVEILGTAGRATAVDFTLSSRTLELRIEKPVGASTVCAIEKIEVPNLYIEEVNLFSGCIQNNIEPPIAPKDALANQMVLDAAMAL